MNPDKISDDTQRGLERLATGHMRPFIEPGGAWIVDSNSGGFVVPLDLVGVPDDWPSAAGFVWRWDGEGTADWLAMLAADLAQYACEGVGPIAGTDVSEIRLERTGYLCRMSAPGYHDCTEWDWFPTRQEAADHLVETYGDDF